MWWGGAVNAKVVASMGRCCSEATHPVDVVQQRGLVGCAVFHRRHGDGFQQQTQGNGHAPVQQAKQQRYHQLRR